MSNTIDRSTLSDRMAAQAGVANNIWDREERLSLPSHSRGEESQTQPTTEDKLALYSHKMRDKKEKET